MSTQEENEAQFTHIIDSMCGYELFAVVDSVVVRADGPISRKMLGWYMSTVKRVLREHLPGRYVKRIDIIHARGWKNWKELKAKNEDSNSLSS